MMPGLRKTFTFLILILILNLTLILWGAAAVPAADGFKRALPGRTYSFPQDHFSHPEFKTEWWYYSGHLQSEEKEKRPFGYQLTFFRTGLKKDDKPRKSKWAISDLFFAHLALTDESSKKFEYREKISRGSLGEAGALPFSKSEKTFRIWIEDWSVEGTGPSLRDHRLKGGNPDLGMDLNLAPERSPVIHGQNGISRKAEGEGYASHYYSTPRMTTEGKIFLKGKEVRVRGQSWMDHEFGSAQLREYQVGWDWFSIQLENGTDLMFYQLRHRDGKIDPYSSGTIIFADGSSKHLAAKDFQIDVLDTWKSPKSGAAYPSKWTIKVPAYRISLTLTPTVKDQELVTQESTRVTYWEGSADVEGKSEANQVRGKGYVEMTGYAKPFSKGI
jgi:predicted secreted hydrolase